MFHKIPHYIRYTTCVIPLAIGLTAGLTGCEGKNAAYHDTREIDLATTQSVATDIPFLSALAREYATFSETEQDEEYDYPDAIHFARKSLNAGSGIFVMPEEIADWDLTKAQAAELHMGHTRLIGALINDAWREMPEKTAIAQARFDCWIEETEENDPDAQKCKSAFMDALSQIETVKRNIVKDEPEAASPLSIAGLQDSGRTQTITFEFDKAELDQSALKIIDNIVAAKKANPEGKITIRGHADRSGSKEYNDVLSFNRAMAVWTALTKRGIDSTNIVFEWAGETEPFNRTPDGKRHQLNRRVEVIY